MLNAAGVDENTPVYIYQYDEERGIYVCRTDSAQDKGKKEVSVPLEKNGEYILGVDVSAPEVSDMNVSNTTASPVFSAKVIDGNGVKDFEMKLDDKEIVNAASFAQYYNEKTGKFTCPLKGLTAGKHTVTITQRIHLEIRQKHRILMNLQLMIKHRKSQRQIFLQTNYSQRIPFM